MSDLPLRMTAIEVCQLGRFSLATLTRKRRQDPSWLPSSPVQGGRSTVFDRCAVLKALALTTDGTDVSKGEWKNMIDAYPALLDACIEALEAYGPWGGKTTKQMDADAALKAAVYKALGVTA